MLKIGDRVKIVHSCDIHHDFSSMKSCVGLYGCVLNVLTPENVFLGNPHWPIVVKFEGAASCMNENKFECVFSRGELLVM